MKVLLLNMNLLANMHYLLYEVLRDVSEAVFTFDTNYQLFLFTHTRNVCMLYVFRHRLHVFPLSLSKYVHFYQKKCVFKMEYNRLQCCMPHL